MSKINLTILGLLLVSIPLLGQCRANISGRVISQSGKPVTGVQVAILPVEAYGNGVQQYCKTDQSGAFHAVLNLRGPGSYSVFAEEEESGYPNMDLAFYQDHKPPLVALRCGAKVSGVVVRLGSKAAYITQIDVLNAATGDPVKDASITLRRVTPPFHAFSPSVFWMSTSTSLMKPGPNYRGLPIPSNTDISYQISAPGFVTSELRIIRLPPKKTTTISVRLQRSSSGAAAHK